MMGRRPTPLKVRASANVGCEAVRRVPRRTAGVRSLERAFSVCLSSAKVVGRQLDAPLRQVPAVAMPLYFFPAAAFLARALAAAASFFSLSACCGDGVGQDGTRGLSAGVGWR